MQIRRDVLWLDEHMFEIGGCISRVGRSLLLSSHCSLLRPVPEATGLAGAIMRMPTIYAARYVCRAPSKRPERGLTLHRTQESSYRSDDRIKLSVALEAHNERTDQIKQTPSHY